MKKTIQLLIILTVFASDVFAAEKMRLAVIDFQSRGISGRTVKAVADLMRSDLVDSGFFTVVERTQMNEILKEQALQMTGCTDNACAVQIGKLLSAKKILMGEISKIGRKVLLTVRIVDVERGIAEFSARDKAKNINHIDTTAVKLIKRLIERISGKRASDLAGLLYPPEDVEASDGCYSDRIKLTWKPVEDAEVYYVFRQEDNGKYRLAGSTSETEFFDKSVKSGLSCTYKVRSGVINRYSEFSDTVSGMKGKSKTGYYLRGLVPGWGQIYYGSTIRGSIILGSFCAIGGLFGYSCYNYTDKKNAYNSLPPLTPADKFNSAYDEYKSAGNLALGTGIALAAIYIYNWVDILLFNEPVYEGDLRNKTSVIETDFNVYRTACADGRTDIKAAGSIGLRF